MSMEGENGHDGADASIDRKKQRTTESGSYRPSREDSVNFDPTAVGLPPNWSLTSFSDLKG